MASLKLISTHIMLVIVSSSYAPTKEPNVRYSSASTIFKGMNLVAPINKLNKTTLLELKEINTNTISLIPYAFVNTEKVSISYNNGKQWWGETTTGIIECIKLSHDNNLMVMLKPHLWINHNTYTGDLNFKTEKDWTKWENEYEQYILNFAKIAQAEKIELFCFGTELRNPIAKRPQYWFQLIKKIKIIYKGKVTYAANWDDFEVTPFWQELDYIGIDAYFPLSKSQTPSIKELKASWKSHIQKIEKVQKKYNKKVIFTEYGYRNSDYCAKEPWSETNNTLNNQAQANSYEALYQTVKNKTWFQGGFAWKWYADDYYKKRKIDYTPQDKSTVEIIKNFYFN
jgi:hypothetical protein